MARQDVTSMRETLLKKVNLNRIPQIQTNSRTSTYPVPILFPFLCFLDKHFKVVVLIHSDFTIRDEFHNIPAGYISVSSPSNLGESGFRINTGNDPARPNFSFRVLGFIENHGDLHSDRKMGHFEQRGEEVSLSGCIATPKCLECGYHAFLNALFFEFPFWPRNFPVIFSPIGVHSCTNSTLVNGIRIPRKSGTKHRRPSVSVPVRWATVEMNPPIACGCIVVATLRASNVPAGQASSPQLTSTAQDLGDLVPAMDCLAATSTRHLVVRLGLNTTLPDLTDLFRRAPIPGHLVGEKV